MHEQTHSFFHTLFHPSRLSCLLIYTSLSLPSWLNRKPRRNGLPSTHFIYDVISYTCCCKTHSPAKQKKTQLPKARQRSRFCHSGHDRSMRKIVMLVVQQQWVWDPVKMSLRWYSTEWCGTNGGGYLSEDFYEQPQHPNAQT